MPSIVKVWLTWSTSIRKTLSLLPPLSDRNCWNIQTNITESNSVTKSATSSASLGKLTIWSVHFLRGYANVQIICLGRKLMISLKTIKPMVKKSHGYFLKKNKHVPRPFANAYVLFLIVSSCQKLCLNTFQQRGFQYINLFDIWIFKSTLKF